MSTSTTNSPYRYGGQQQQQQQQYLPSQDYFIEHYIAMLVEEAEKLYTKLELSAIWLLATTSTAVNHRHCYHHRH